MILITPALAFLPNSVPCGPRSTSSRATSARSLKASAARLSTTPSSTVETEGSTAIENEVVPSPRRNRVWFSEVPALTKLSEGTSCVAPSRLAREAPAMASPLNTDTATGTACRRSERFCAVTTISPGALSSLVAAGSAAADCAMAGVATRARARLVSASADVVRSMDFMSVLPWAAPLSDGRRRIAGSALAPVPAVHAP